MDEGGRRGGGEKGGGGDASSLAAFAPEFEDQGDPHDQRRKEMVPQLLRHAKGAPRSGAARACFCAGSDGIGSTLQKREARRTVAEGYDRMFPEVGWTQG